MRLNCPKTCPLTNHPEVGFFPKTLKAGERFVVKRSDVNNFLFLTKGSFTVTSEERRNYHVEQKHFIVCYHRFRYEITAVEDCEFMLARFVNLGIACDMGALAKMHKKHENDENYKYEFSAVPFVPVIEDMLKPIYTYVEDDIPCGTIYRAQMETIFTIIRFYYTGKVQYRMFYNFLGRDMSFKALVENNTRKARNLNHLAELCGYEIANFNVLFRRYYPDITPHVWMQERRKHEILEYLQKSDARIHFVATRFGFSSSSHLGEFCKKYLGDTPRNLRNKYLQEQGRPIDEESSVVDDDDYESYLS